VAGHKAHHPAYSPFLYSIGLAGLAVMALAILRLASDRPSYQWIFVALLTVLTGAFPIKIPQISYMLSMEDTLVFTNMILFGPGPGVITAALQGIMGSASAKSANRRREFAIFNVSALVVAAYLSGDVFFRTYKQGPVFVHPPAGFIDIAVPITLMALTYYCINSTSVALIISLDQRKRMYQVWQQNFSWTWITYVTAASVAALIALNVKTAGFLLIAVSVPFVLVTYFTYKTYRDKVEGQVQQINELNDLYLRTVESLALAVDAKDQTTHGHIRRVRIFSLRLARFFGVEDKKELLAIETAALLHDIGKLAIEDYLLNKPGKLSRQEFDRMKEHAAAGEEIIKQIRFPFPAAKYVRSHHEQWGGKGYPDGLRGQEIPLGSRILAIADVYDALRSSRPYKRALSIEEAIQELRNDSGIAFDPDLTEIFISHVHELEAEAKEAEHDMPRLELKRADWNQTTTNVTRSEATVPLENDVSEELVSLYEFCAGLGKTLDAGDICANLACRLKRMIPFDLGIVFLARPDNYLQAAHVSGRQAGELHDLRIEFGKGISGWVAAYQKAMINSKPVLDFRGLSADLGSLSDSLIVPLIQGEACLGTISLYSGSAPTYADSHLSTLRMVASLASPLLAVAARRDPSPSRKDKIDPVTGVRSMRYLAAAGVQLIESCSRDSSNFYLAQFRLTNVAELVDRYGFPTRDWILQNVARTLLGEIRDKDILAQFGQEGFIVLFAGASRTQMLRRVQHLHRLIAAIQVHEGAFVACDIGAAYFPDDGKTVFELLDVARQSSLACDPVIDGKSATDLDNVVDFPATVGA
jgi:diguanylate cyclase (GGDEF)-like protein/putative nucleotidyltransferase with HDIG domain